MKRFHEEVVTPDVVLVDTNALRKSVGLVKKDTVGLLVLGGKVTVNKNVHHSVNSVYIDLAERIVLVHILDTLKHTAHCDSVGRRISRLICTIVVAEIPICNVVGRKVVKKIVGGSLEYLHSLLILLVDVSKERTVNAPSLTSAPSRIVICTLMCTSSYRKTGLGIEVIGVVGAGIGTANVVNGGVEVLERLNSVGLITGNLSSPVKERNVKKAVYDETVVLRIGNVAPSLNELALLLISGKKMVSSHNCSSLALLIACELVCSYARGSEEEAHVMMVNTDLLGNSLGVAGNMRKSYFLVLIVAGELVCVPEDTGPEAVTPACYVLHSSVNVILTKLHREDGAEIIDTLIDLSKAYLERLFKLLARYAEIRILIGIINHGDVGKHISSP